jgi:hypothetical protein
MNNSWKWFLLAISLIAISEKSRPTSPQESDVMLVAVSHDARMLGLGPEKENAKGTAFVEPLARLTSSGEWKSLPCFADRDGKKYAATQQEDCSKFEKVYLSKPHTYTVVSADGRGATVSAQPVALDECLSYTEKGTYSGANIATSAIGASSSDFFSDSPPPRLLSSIEAKPFLKAFAAAVPGGLDSNSHLRAFSLRLEGQELILLQRAYDESPGTKLIFAIGKMDQDIFQMLHWKENVSDEDEVAVGTVHLANGRDFLITTVTDPEGQWFRVYGIRQGRLLMVYSGGGSSC